MKGGGLPLWWRWTYLAGLVWLIGSSAVFADTVEKKWLGGADPLFERNDYYDNGYALRELTPIKDLPKSIAFKPSEVSLVADPTDSRGDYMVVYLVNDTDDPLQEVIGELQKARTQVKVGGCWLSDEIPGFVCGSVPPPTDLAARSALVLGVWYARKGEYVGQRRFVFDLKTQRITSEPIFGVYSMANVEKCLDSPASELLMDGMENHLFRNRWGGWVRSPEEFVAMLELARHQDQFVYERRELLNWVLQRKEQHDASPELARAIDEIVSVLGKPWLMNNDQQALVSRSLAALRRSKSDQYGTPENCHTVVWRYLSYPRLDLGPSYFRSESHAPNEDSLTDLGRMAANVMSESKDSDEIKAVGGFLVSHSLAERHFPSDYFREYLKTGETNHIRIGLAGLALRGMAEEAGIWLSKHTKDLGLETAGCYSDVSGPVFGRMRDWEYPVIGFMLDSYPLESISASARRLREVAKENVPDLWESSLRRFLQNELSPERKAWWIKRANESKSYPASMEVNRDVESLVAGIQLLGRWGNDSDRNIIRAYLDHPAATFQETGHGVGKMSFRARTAAKEILFYRHETLPANLITEKPVVTVDQTPEPFVAIEFIKAKTKELLAFLAGAAFLALCWLINTRRRLRVIRLIPERDGVD